MELQENPVQRITPGEGRTLRGYKIQFKSITGFYDCIDLDLKASNDPNPVRPVNVNTLEWLTINGVHYVVE
jgi:hypothetical protein